MAGRPLLFFHDFTSRNGFNHVFMTKISFTSIANLAHFSTLDNKTVFVMYCFEISNSHFNVLAERVCNNLDETLLYIVCSISDEKINKCETKKESSFIEV